MTEDNGFGENTVFTDTLTSSDNQVAHYFESNGLALGITLYKTESDKKNETKSKVLTNSDYTLSLDESTMSIKFGSGLSEYKYATITYNSIAKVSDIHGTGTEWDNGEQTATVTFSNTAAYNQGHDTKSYSYTNENPAVVKRFTLSLNKNWSDETDISKRPDYIVVRLMRKKSTEDDTHWEYIYPVSADETDPELIKAGWRAVTITDETNEEEYTFTALRSNNWQLYWENLPQDTEEHNFEYQYKIDELPVEYYKTTYPDEPVTYSSNRRNYSIKNARDSSIKKYVLDKDGKRIEGDRLSIDNIVLAKIDESHRLSQNGDEVNHYKGQYYLIGYEVEINIRDDSKYTLTDTIPEGFVFAYNMAGTNYTTAPSNPPYPYQPEVNGADVAGVFEGYNSHGYVALDENTRQVKSLNVDQYVHSIKYYIHIPKADLENALGGDTPIQTINNEIEGSDKFKASSEVTLTKTKTDHEDTSVIKKSVVLNEGAEIPDIDPSSGEVVYKLVVNPKAAKLAPANKSTYDIVDILNIPDKSIKADIISVVAKEITINDENAFDPETQKYVGTYIEKKVQDITYSYVPGDSSVTETDLSSNFIFKAIDTEKKRFSADAKEALQVGDEVTFKIKGYGTTFENNAITFDVRGYGTKVQGEGWYLIQYVEKAALYSYEFYNDGTYEVVYKHTVTESDVNNGLYNFEVKSNGQPLTGVTARVIRKKTNDSGELVITVPDSKALLITYTYKFSRKGKITEENPSGLTVGETINITNEASIDTGTVSSWDKMSDTAFSVTEAGGTIQVDNEHPSLIKRDIQDWNLSTLRAGFYVARYEDGKWIFCNETKEMDIKDSGDNKIGEYTDLKFSKTVGEGENAKTVIAQANGNEIPDGAVQVIVENGSLDIDIIGNRVYKFIEVQLPEGYEGTNLTPITYGGKYLGTFEALLNDYLANQESRSKDVNYPYRYFFNNFIAVHYFAYDPKSNVINLKQLLNGRENVWNA